MLYEIETDTNGNKLPRINSIEKLFENGDATKISNPLNYQVGLIARFNFREKIEFILYINDEKRFLKIKKDFQGVEDVITWGLMNPIEAMRISGFVQ